MMVSMALIPPLMRWAGWARLVDVPDARKVHTDPVPRVGGIAIVAGALLPVMMWVRPTPAMAAYLAATLVIFAFGLWDDRANLDYRTKFLGQLVAALIVVAVGGVQIRYFPFLEGTLPPAVAIPFTVLALLAITNAINLADGLDGLAGGTTLLSLCVIALLAHQHDPVVLLIALAIIGAVLGFLRFNTHPARVFMGDSGSQFLGFSAGVLAILLTQQADTALSPSLPMLLLGLPILDTVVVMGQRIWERRSPFSPDKNHIHHKLLAVGFDHYEAVFLIYMVQAWLILAAYFLRYRPDAWILGTYLAICLVVMGFFRWAGITGWRAHRATGVPLTALTRYAHWLRHGRKLVRFAAAFAAVTIPAFAAGVMLFADSLTRDLGFLAAGLAATLTLVFLYSHGQALSWVERAVAYVIAAFTVYLAETGSFLESFDFWLDTYFVLLAVVVVIGFRFSESDRFQMTPLDFLVIFIAFTAPNLPDLQSFGGLWAEGVAKLIVLFYGVEFTFSQLSRSYDGVRAALLALLAVAALRGLEVLG